MEGKSVMTEQTERFIAENPTDVVFFRNVKTPDGAGGSATTPTPLPAQTVRIVQQATAQGTERRTVSGEVVRPDIKVVAMPDVNVELGDTFKWRNQTHEVVWSIDMPYERTLEVAAI